MKIKNYLFILLLIISDIIALCLSFYSSYWIRIELLPKIFSFLFKEEGFFLITHFYKFWSILFVYILFFFYERIYHKQHTFWVELIYIIRGLFISSVLLILFIYFSRGESLFARTIIVLMFLSGIVFVPLLRYLFKYLMFRLNLYQKKIAIIVKKNSIKRVYNALSEEWYLGYKISGVISSKKINLKKCPFLGYIKNLKFIIKNYNLDEVVIIEEGFHREKRNQIIGECEAVLPKIKLIPDVLALKTIGVHPEYINEILLLSIPNNLAVPINQIYKGLFDFLLSFIISLIFLPFFIIITILIKLDSPGPVFFTQDRIGHRGENFKFLKFRSMYINGDKILNDFIKKHKWAQREWKQYQKLKSYDPRVTRIGKFLRRFSIDEMPQIFNVLVGNMSIVGPRPYLPREKKVIGKYFSIILKVKPGLTGLWQTRGRNKLTFKTRLKLDEFYVRNWSFFLDFIILGKTLNVVISGVGAY